MTGDAHWGTPKMFYFNKNFGGKCAAGPVIMEVLCA